MSKESNDVERLIIAAVMAHRGMHIPSSSGTVCGGGIGGQMFTNHCALTCGYNHSAEEEAWRNVEQAFFSRRRGDPDWARFLPEE